MAADYARINPMDFSQPTISVSDNAHLDDRRPILSVIVPVFNEQRTVAELLDRVLAVGLRSQVIVVDDGSTDQTSGVLREWNRDGRVQFIRHEANRGKGAAIRSGLQRARGHFTIIQDADLEYDPQDYPCLLVPLLKGRAQVVYGSRYLDRGSTKGWSWSLFRIGVSLLNLCVQAIYGARLTDEATCYKVFATATLRAMELECEQFDFCPEVTAKALRMGLRIEEVPISYHARKSNAGKKIRYRDGVSAIWALWKWRNWQPSGQPAGVERHNDQPAQQEI